jgi:hypothetical protein
MPELRELKIECENWWWNRRLQFALNEKYGVNWGMKVPLGWNCRKRGKYLFLVQNPENKTWWFSWGTSSDFQYSPLPATTAKQAFAEFVA